MKQHFYNYELWEDTKHNFYDKDDITQDVKRLRVMRDHNLWGEYMLKVILDWHYSSLQNMTNPSVNKIAWIGQASMSLALNTPSKTTKRLWWSLTDEERKLANAEAKLVIRVFERLHNA